MSAPRTPTRPRLDEVEAQLRSAYTPDDPLGFVYNMDVYGELGKTVLPDLARDFRVVAGALRLEGMPWDGGHCAWCLIPYPRHHDECRYVAASDVLASWLEETPTPPICPTCNNEGVVERLATPDEVDNGCELGIAFDPCPNEAWHNRGAS